MYHNLRELVVTQGEIFLLSRLIFQSSQLNIELCLNNYKNLQYLNYVLKVMLVTLTVN